MADPQTYDAEEALESGVLGTVHDPIENEAYTVSGQGPETAKREREATRELRARWQDASQEGEAPAKSKSSSKGSSSSGSSGSSGSSSS